MFRPAKDKEQPKQQAVGERQNLAVILSVAATESRDGIAAAELKPHLLTMTGSDTVSSQKREPEGYGHCEPFHSDLVKTWETVRDVACVRPVNSQFQDMRQMPTRDPMIHGR